ncbi:MAG: hypothetical protein PHR77_04775 [Kiritimatiellae bacterium]|nr:hypothetical protein [Kiritimatiellia bacterium]MDD5519458.1 hypothetical protein [Kiritimatiellia bacterium]
MNNKVNNSLFTQPIKTDVMPWNNREICRGKAESEYKVYMAKGFSEKDCSEMGTMEVGVK